MAEGVQVKNKSLEELESEITCGICQEHYTEPKILPCLHYYCKQCILTLAQRSATGKPFHCPECRCAATLPEGGVDQLRTAFFINRLKSKVTTIERVHGKVEVKCELCVDSTSNAEAFCRQCARFICKDCVKLHTRIQTFQTHEIASLDDLKYGRAKPIMEQGSPIVKCEVHEEPLTLYCFDCSHLICRDCTVKDHRDHNFEFTKKAAPEVKTKLLKDLKTLKQLCAKFNSAADNIGITKYEVCTQKESVIEVIHTSFKEVYNLLDKREKELVEEANRLSQQKIEKLSVQEKTLSLASVEVQSVVEHTERCVGLSADNEVMSMHTEIGKKIELKMQEYSEAQQSLEPVEVADIGVEVKLAEDLQQLCITQAVISKLPVDPAKCTVDLPRQVCRGRLCLVTLTTRLSNNKQAKRECEIYSHLTFIDYGDTKECTITEIGSGKYSIECTPTVYGRHELSVLIDEQHVAGSPFTVRVASSFFAGCTAGGFFNGRTAGMGSKRSSKTTRK